MASKQLPSVGRMVHVFDLDEDIPYAAIITGVVSEAMPTSEIDVVVFRTFGMEFSTNVPHASTGRDHFRWDWPAYVAPVTVPDEE